MYNKLKKMNKIKTICLLLVLLISFKSFALTFCDVFGLFCHKLSDVSSFNPIQTSIKKKVLTSGSRVNQCTAQLWPSYINFSIGVAIKKGINNDYKRGEKYFNILKKMSPSILIQSAGNKHPRPIPHYKIKMSQILDAILVGSLDPNGEKSKFSQEAEEVHITAPSGKSLTSIGHNGKYRKFSGTSGATPLVTGSLASFEWLAGYHPTAEESKLLLKNTAIPVPSSVKGGPGYGINGHGMVNAYKLAMFGKRLKKECEKDIDCFKREINNPESYLRFDLSAKDYTNLLDEISQVFPECDNRCNTKQSQNNQCQSKKDLFKELRKAAFLSPKNGELWRTIACIYKQAGFTEDAKMALAIYKSTEAGSGARVEGNYQKCDSDNDCTLVSVNSECYSDAFGKSQTKNFLPMNKASAEIYYLKCMEDGEAPPKCNGKCRCSDTEIAINEPAKDEISSPSIVSKTQYNTRCEKNQCVMDTEEILFGKSANDGSLILEDQSITSPSSSGAIQ